jgi:O-antigen biosynthesis protein
VLALTRCDLTLVCSPVELELLRDHYGVPAGKLALAPFFVPRTQAQGLPPFAERSHFVSIGNFKHAPNLDSVGYHVPSCPS